MKFLLVLICVSFTSAVIGHSWPATIVCFLSLSGFCALGLGRLFAFGSAQDANDRAESEAASVHHNPEL